MKAFLAALLLAACAPALAMPSEITAEYELTTGGMTIGRMKETFVRKDDTYSIQSVTRSEGMLKLLYDDQLMLSSTGRVVQAGLQPLAFAQHRARDGARDIETTFDWERGISRTVIQGEQSEVPLPRETQDRLSVMYQFMNLDARGGVVVVSMTNNRRVETYTYRFVDEARIATAAGEFDTMHYQRVTAGPKENRADVWLAKDRFNFPVRVVFDDPKGLRVQQTLVALQSR
jgi:Protein of unknown function (DUF3108)